MPKLCNCGKPKFIDMIVGMETIEQGGTGYGAYIKCKTKCEPVCLKCYVEKSLADCDRKEVDDGHNK